MNLVYVVFALSSLAVVFVILFWVSVVKLRSVVSLLNKAVEGLYRSHSDLAKQVSHERGVRSDQLIDLSKRAEALESRRKNFIVAPGNDAGTERWYLFFSEKIGHYRKDTRVAVLKAWKKKHVSVWNAVAALDMLISESKGGKK